MFLRISLFLFLLSLSFLSASPLKVEVTANSAVLMNAQNGRILFDKKMDEATYPASITKIATTLFALEQEQGHLDRSVKASFDALRTIDPKKHKEKIPSYLLETDGMTMNIRIGEKIPLHSLLHGVMLASANDAANVLAEYCSGSIPKFMDGLNSYINNLGCQKTQFVTPHGLHHPNHKTTAHDMAIITAEAIKNPSFRKLCSTIKYTIPKTNKSEPREINNYNRLIKKNSPFYYQYALGGKTGYTKAAQSTLVAIAEKEGRQLIAVLLGCSSKDERFKDAKRLFEVAFSQTSVSQRIFKKNKTFSAKVSGGDKLLVGGMIEDVVLEYFPAEKPELKAYLQWEQLNLPITKGQQVGELWLVTPQNEVIKKQPIFAKEKVGKTLIFAVSDFFHGLFSKKDTVAIHTE